MTSRSCGRLRIASTDVSSGRHLGAVGVGVHPASSRRRIRSPCLRRSSTGTCCWPLRWERGATLVRREDAASATSRACAAARCCCAASAAGSCCSASWPSIDVIQRACVRALWFSPGKLRLWHKLHRRVAMASSLRRAAQPSCTAQAREHRTLTSNDPKYVVRCFTDTLRYKLCARSVCETLLEPVKATTFADGSPSRCILYCVLYHTQGIHRLSHFQRRPTSNSHVRGHGGSELRALPRTLSPACGTITSGDVCRELDSDACSERVARGGYIGRQLALFVKLHRQHGANFAPPAAAALRGRPLHTDAGTWNS